MPKYTPRIRFGGSCGQFQLLWFMAPCYLVHFNRQSLALRTLGAFSLGVRQRFPTITAISANFGLPVLQMEQLNDVSNCNTGNPNGAEQLFIKTLRVVAVPWCRSKVPERRIWPSWCYAFKGLFTYDLSQNRGEADPSLSSFSKSQKSADHLTQLCQRKSDFANSSPLTTFIFYEQSIICYCTHWWSYSDF